jgi:hypothetical protein
MWQSNTTFLVYLRNNEEMLTEILKQSLTSFDSSVHVHACIKIPHFMLIIVVKLQLGAHRTATIPKLQTDFGLLKCGTEGSS